MTTKINNKIFDVIDSAFEMVMLIENSDSNFKQRKEYILKCIGINVRYSLELLKKNNKYEQNESYLDDSKDNLMYYSLNYHVHANWIDDWISEKHVPSDMLINSLNYFLDKIKYYLWNSGVNDYENKINHIKDYINTNLAPEEKDPIWNKWEVEKLNLTKKKFIISKGKIVDISDKIYEYRCIPAEKAHKGKSAEITFWSKQIMHPNSMYEFSMIKRIHKRDGLGLYKYYWVEDKPVYIVCDFEKYFLEKYDVELFLGGMGLHEKMNSKDFSSITSIFNIWMKINKDVYEGKHLESKHSNRDYLRHASHIFKCHNISSKPRFGLWPAAKNPLISNITGTSFKYSIKKIIWDCSVADGFGCVLGEINKNIKMLLDSQNILKIGIEETSFNEKEIESFINLPHYYQCDSEYLIRYEKTDIMVEGKLESMIEITNKKYGVMFNSIETIKSEFETNQKLLPNFINNYQHFKQINYLRLSFISGPPGYGKTESLVRTIKDNPNISWTIVTPTWKAALRYANLNMKHYTIQKILTGESDFKKHISTSDNRIVILEEMSMYGFDEINYILDIVKGRAYGDNIRIVFMGDINQLPPIDSMPMIEIMKNQFDEKYFFNIKHGASSLLSDKTIKYEDYRTSAFVNKYKKIVHKKDLENYVIAKKNILTDILDKKISYNDKYYKKNLIYFSNYSSLLGLLQIENSINLFPEHYNHILKPKFIVWKNKGIISTTMLKIYLKNTTDQFMENEEVIWDSSKTMHTMNCLGQNSISVVNGTMLEIVKKDKQEITSTYHLKLQNVKSCACENFKDGTCNVFTMYNVNEGEEKFITSYAITCHKAQGQTIDYPIIIVDTPFIGRKWLYTAVSRAQGPFKIYITSKFMGIIDDN